MESKVVGYCAIAAVLGIIAAATGFAAEATKVKASEILIEYDTCIYPSSPALALGIVSAVITIITRIYISVSFGGSGCCRIDPNSTPISKLLFVLSWVASVIAVVLLLTAAGLNNKRYGEIDSNDIITCYVYVKAGTFAGGAILALLSTVLGIAAYITSTPPPQTTTNPAAFAFPMGNVDPEKNPVPFPPQQNPPQQYPPQQYPPQQQY